MIYQVKSISGYVWGVQGCAGVCGVCSARVCMGVRGCARVYMGVCRCAQVCVDMHGNAQVCGINFQNFFRRIESLRQQTLILVLYEFLANNLPDKMISFNW